MADYYDPYSYGQDTYSYNQDPYANYNPGYDTGYAYDNYDYNDPYAFNLTSSEPPPPDKDWEDPVKTNREYVKKITKSCIHKGFEGLKQKGLFLFEALIRQINLKKSLIGSSEPNPSQESDKNALPFKPVSYVKFLNFPFLEVDEVGDDDLITKSGADLKDRTFNKLFQEIFTTTERRSSLLVESEKETDEEEKTSKGDIESEKLTAERTNTVDKSENDNAPKEDEETFILMAGKSVMVTMSGLSMTQKLLEHPLVVRVSRPRDNEESETLGTCSIRPPAPLSRAIVLSSQVDSFLPCNAVSTEVYDLVDDGGERVGSVEVTITLTCFGKGVVNCMMDNGYEHTFPLRQLKMKYSIADDKLKLPYANPELAADLMEMDFPCYPEVKTSSQILNDCVNNDLVPMSCEERTHALGYSNCEWFRMLERAYPPPPTPVVDEEEIMRQLEIEEGRLLVKQRQICRDFLREEPPVRTTFEERLKDLRTLRDMEEEASKKSAEVDIGEQQIQTGLLGMETNNPFEEAVRASVNTGSNDSESSKNKPKSSKKSKRNSQTKSK